MVRDTAIVVSNLSKSYKVAIQRSGWAGIARDFVNRQYRQVEALRGISFEVRKGEVVGLIGPNGAGKTTALKILSGLLHPTSGSAKVAGRVPWERHRDFLCSIGMVMGQRSQLWWELSALDAVLLVARAYGLTPKLVRKRIEELAYILAVQDLMTTPVRNLSLGERMKFELMASLVHNPAILFLDEPTLGLDLMAQRALRGFLRSCNEQYGTTIVLTSHYLSDIQALCPRAIILHQGSIVFDGNLDALRAASQLKLVQVQGIPEYVDLNHWGLQWEASTLCWKGAVDPSQLGTLLRTVIDLGMVSLTVEDPPLEDVIAKIYAEGGLKVHA